MLKKVKIKLEIYATGTCTQKIKVLCIIWIKFLTSSWLFWTYWQFTSRLAANQVHAVT